MKKVAKKPTLKIMFANQDALEHFASWLCESGEQSYWDWMEVREEEEVGDITAVELDYHGKKVKDNKPRYGKFMCDNTIRTVCGRLGRNE